MSFFQIEVRSVFSPPNAITLLGLSCGVASVWALWELENETLCLSLVMLAIILDFVDGLVARKLKAESNIGATLDALCDAVNFGAVPVLLLIYKIDAINGFILFGLLVYMSALVVRLSIFLTNCLCDAQQTASPYFRGVPAPAAAILLVTPYFTPLAGAFEASAITLHLLVAASLCLSMVPTPSLKHRRLTVLLVIFVGAAALGFVLDGVSGIFTSVAVTYLLSILLMQVFPRTKALRRRKVK